MNSASNKEKYNTIVIKIGSSSLTDKKGQLDINNLSRLCQEIAEVKKQGKRIIIVTSGSVISGSQKLNLTGKLKSISQKQAAAAVGQSLLMKEYDQAFKKFGITVAQILLTRDAIEDRERYINARHTLTELLDLDVIPIVNENDTVAVEEIMVGDNDTLAALVSSLIGADLLINLTDVEGFLSKNDDGTAQLIPEIKEIDKNIEKWATPSKTQTGTGGMQTKLEASKICSHAGIYMVIAHGRKENIIKAILKGDKIGTSFIPTTQKLISKKRWIAHGLKKKGSLVIDNGAVSALIKNGKSLLPVGIKSIEGKFIAGDLVSIYDENKKEVARGVVNLNSDDMEKVIGQKDMDVVIHRDNMVIL